jgi:undecaprenyl phosphate N,N'-diacetylbacillosamine 1-phosphate transferase
MADVGTGFYRRWGKRAFDLVVTSLALLLLWPLLLVIALLVKLTSRGPVLFRQERLGRNATTFMAYKFRTMTDKPRVPDTLYYTGDPSEITPFGRFLRRTKLDELPQIFNVLRGEMSLVGPRPQLPAQLAEFDENARLRLLVSPGLTGLAQVNGNTVLNWKERWHYDAEYVRMLTFALDCQIVFRTIGVLVAGEERFTRKPEGTRKEQ